jgi:putative ABC transport system substrate-binding protein
MNRRDLLTLLGGAVASWPVILRAQDTKDRRKVGILMGIGPSGEATTRVKELKDVLGQLGWVEGQNIEFDTRYSDGDLAKIRGYAAELVANEPNVLVAHAPLVLSELRKLTDKLPIVFVQVPFPVESGFINSLARPGGNITGATIFEASMAGKWLELLAELAPKTQRVLVLENSDNPTLVHFIRAIQRAAPLRKIELSVLDGHDIDDAAHDLEVFAATAGGGMIVLPDLYTATHYRRIIRLAASSRLPAIYPFRYMVADGGLIYYGVVLSDMYRKAATYVDRILRGAAPGELPVEAPNEFELVINAKTASQLSLKIPPTLLARADEVIE